MSFISKIGAWWTFKQNRGHPGQKRMYILDTTELSARRRGGGRPGPSEQVQLLKRLATFAEKERIQLTALLPCRPLREAEDGGRFNGVTVRYAERGEALPDIALSLLKDAVRRGDATVITANRKLEERVVGLGGTSMRTSTFRKAMDSVSGNGDARSPSSQKRRPRRRRRNPPRSGSDANRKEPPKERAGDTAVRELLDLVE